MCVRVCFVRVCVCASARGLIYFWQALTTSGHRMSCQRWLDQQRQHHSSLIYFLSVWCHYTHTHQVNNILQARNDELEKTMAQKGVGFLEEAATQEGAVQTARFVLVSGYHFISTSDCRSTSIYHTTCMFIFTRCVCMYLCMFIGVGDFCQNKIVVSWHRSIESLLSIYIFMPCLVCA